MDDGGAPWIKAKASDAEGVCVEVQTLADGTRRVRDSKDREGPVLTFTRAEWEAFLHGARNGEFG